MPPAAAAAAACWQHEEDVGAVQQLVPLVQALRRACHHTARLATAVIPAHAPPPPRGSRSRWWGMMETS